MLRTCIRIAFDYYICKGNTALRSLRETATLRAGYNILNTENKIKIERMLTPIIKYLAKYGEI